MFYGCFTEGWHMQFVTFQIRQKIQRHQNFKMSKKITKLGEWIFFLSQSAANEPLKNAKNFFLQKIDYCPPQESFFPKTKIDKFDQKQKSHFFLILKVFFKQSGNIEKIDLPKFQRQFWKAESMYFPNISFEKTSEVCKCPKKSKIGNVSDLLRYFWRPL
jgi:hypothetical protein